MIRFYYYKHPKTGEIFSDQRMEGYEDVPLIVKGVKCELVRDYIPPEFIDDKYHLAIINKNREVWEADPQYIKKCNPKFVKLQDGSRVRYDPTKHC